jgi:tetratricopeptide (TPR) repeat protein
MSSTVASANTVIKTRTITKRTVVLKSPGYVMQGYISTAPAPVRLAGEDVFTIKAPAGGFTAEERSIIIERNLNNALISSKDRSPSAVEIVTINHLPVIRVGGKHVLTIDSNLAMANGATMEGLAEQWANNMKHALSDSAKVNSYVAQLSGDYLYSPYSPPYREAQWKAARLNHAAFEARPGLPLDLVSSASVRDCGFDAMLKRDPVAAEAFFRKALAMEPGNERAHYGLGASLLKQGKVDQAIPELDLARWLDHDDAQVHLAMGQAMESKGLDKEAITRYREAGLLHPEDPAPALFIADIREARDDISKSVVELTEAAANCPQSDYLRLRRKDQIGWRLIRPY